MWALILHPPLGWQVWRGALVHACLAFSLLDAAPLEAAFSKSGYTLFRATPDSLLRDLSADRPDATESPYTVDAGHIQVEADLVAYTRDDDASTRAESWSVMAMNLKFGLNSATDFQIVAESHTFERVSDLPSGARLKRDGFGDLTLRLKRNLSGNDEGRVAVGVMPFVSIPVGGVGEEAAAFGTSFPVAVDLGSGSNLGLMGEVDNVEDGDEDGRHFEWVATATVGRGIYGPLSGFVEFAATFRPREEGTWIGNANSGITYSLSPNTQLDAGIYAGVTDNADDKTFFLGLTARR